MRDRTAAAAIEASFSASADFKRNGSSPVTWVSNAEYNSTRSFSASARSASQDVRYRYYAREPASHSTHPVKVFKP